MFTTETINLATTLSLTAGGSPSTWSQPVTLTASITPAAAAGTVVFYDGATQLGSAALSGGSAQLTTTQLAVGSHTLSAAYNPNAGYGASTSPAVTQTVNKAPTQLRWFVAQSGDGRAIGRVYGDPFAGGRHRQRAVPGRRGIAGDRTGEWRKRVIHQHYAFRREPLDHRGVWRRCQLQPGHIRGGDRRPYPRRPAPPRFPAAREPVSMGKACFSPPR